MPRVPPSSSESGSCATGLPPDVSARRRRSASSWKFLGLGEKPKDRTRKKHGKSRECNQQLSATVSNCTSCTFGQLFVETHAPSFSKRCLSLPALSCHWAVLQLDLSNSTWCLIPLSKWVKRGKTAIITGQIRLNLYLGLLPTY